MKLSEFIAIVAETEATHVSSSPATKRHSPLRPLALMSNQRGYSA